MEYYIFVVFLFLNNNIMIQYGMNTKGNTTITFPVSYSNTKFCFLYALDYGSNSVSWEEATGGGSYINNNRTISTCRVGIRVGNWFVIGK